MKLAIKLGILSAGNIVIAFLMQSYVLVQLGPGVETDALFAGMTVPQLVLAVISGSLMHVLVPLFSGESEDRLRHDAWAFIALVGGLFGILAVFLYAAAPWWVPFTVPGFGSAGRELTVELTRIQLIGMVFAAISGVQWATYHARQQFLWAEFSPILVSSFVFLVLIWALPRYGVIAAAWISTLRMGLQTLLLAPGVGRPVLPDLQSDAIREAWRRIKPLLLGTTYYKTDPLVDRFLLSMAGSGSLSLYCLAQQVYGAVSQVLNRAIAVPLVPALSQLSKAGDKVGFKRIFKRSMLHVGAISLAGLLVLALFGQTLFALLAGYGHIFHSDLNLLWLMMLLMSGQFVIGNIGLIMTSMFYSLGDTKSPTLVGIVAYSLGVGIKILLFYVMGTLGIALAVSVYYLISLLLMAKIISDKKYA